MVKEFVQKQDHVKTKIVPTSNECGYPTHLNKKKFTSETHSILVLCHMEQMVMISSKVELRISTEISSPR